jgi:hypothetical protein
MLDLCPPEFRGYSGPKIARLVGVRRAVGLVEDALRGRRFRERL